jgi:hypothetical protein
MAAFLLLQQMMDDAEKERQRRSEELYRPSKKADIRKAETQGGKMADHSQMKLGKRPAKYVEGMPQIRDYLTGTMLPKKNFPKVKLPSPKTAVDWMSKITTWPMYANDVKGDCAIAAIGHIIEQWSFNSGNPMVIPKSEVLRVYKILSPNDDGCVLVDVLNWWLKNPIAGIELIAYAQVNQLDLNEMKVCMDIFGGLYNGAQLPILAQTQDVWHVVSGTLHSPEGCPGGWGGHCFPYGYYNDVFSSPGVGQTIPGMTKLSTWGAVKEATWSWQREYVDECYALIAPPFFQKNGETPEGINLPALLADLKQVVP